ncbi:MAG: hypothetical protein JXQ89_09260 [Pelagimonas sp.]|jgi:hypothetical protein
MLTRTKLTKLCEISGSALAIIYAVAIASNTGREVLGFALLLISATLFAIWALADRRWAFLLLQGFYIGSAVLGLVRWA